MRAEIEVYPNALRGWCVPDDGIGSGGVRPQSESKPSDNKADAERAWGKLVALYKGGVVIVITMGNTKMSCNRARIAASTDETWIGFSAKENCVRPKALLLQSLISEIDGEFRP